MGAFSLGGEAVGVGLGRCLDVGAGGVHAGQATEGEGGAQGDAGHGHGVLHEVAAALDVAGGVKALDGGALGVQGLQLLVHLKAAHEHEHARAAERIGVEGRFADGDLPKSAS